MMFPLIVKLNSNLLSSNDLSAVFVGATSVRIHVLDHDNRSPSEDELQENLELRHKLRKLLRSIEGQKVKACRKAKTEKISVKDLKQSRAYIAKSIKN